jgi:hypothetical protein
MLRLMPLQLLSQFKLKSKPQPPLPKPQLPKLLQQPLPKPQLLLLLCKNKTLLESQNMTTLSTTSPTTPSMTHLSKEDKKKLVHTPPTDSRPENGLLFPKETRTISAIKTSMKKLLDSLELIRTPFQSHSLEEMELTQSTDGPTPQQAESVLTKEPLRISVIPTLMRRSSVSSELIKT